jgi:hypothetical protein
MIACGGVKIFDWKIGSWMQNLGEKSDANQPAASSPNFFPDALVGGATRITPLAKVNGRLRKVAFSVMALPYSDATFVMAFENECTEPF